VPCQASFFDAMFGVKKLVHLYYGNGFLVSIVPAIKTKQFVSNILKYARYFTTNMASKNDARHGIVFLS